MRVFLTGATGYIGGAVAAALRERGHDVTALVRPDAEARALRDSGVALVAGDLAALPSLREALADHDCYVHAAQSRSRDSVALDKTAIDVFTSQNGHVVYTSGVWVLGNGVADEESPVNPIALVAWRGSHEEQVLRSGRHAVLRPGCVYGGKQSLLADWFSSVDQGRPISIVGDGRNRWALVDLHDLADCYVRIVEQQSQGILHAVDDSRSTLEECARAMSKDAPIEKTPADAVRPKLGPFTDALTIDQEVSSDITRHKLGWMPKRTFTTSVEEQWREWRATQA